MRIRSVGGKVQKRENRHTGRNLCSRATLSATNSILTGLRLNPGLVRSEQNTGQDSNYNIMPDWAYYSIVFCISVCVGVRARARARVGVVVLVVVVTVV